MTTAEAAEAAVVDADGTYGTHATVWFAGSLADCKAYAKRSRSVVVVCGCSRPVGSQITQHTMRTLTQGGLWKIMR
jgi:hypothetical protein